ncbi:MAG: integrase domain-containing protein [Gammaproteobacteria bacterium]|nr:integrase domain-containing protein [Gammaproteobacteria bacterium]
MRELNYDLKRLQATHRDASHGTRKARSYALAQIANTLHDLGFRGLKATGLRRKHAVALVKEWKRQGRTVGTMKNRTAHIRWWAERIGRPGVVPSNDALGIAKREYVTNEDKSVVLDPEKLTLVKDPHVAMALRMEAEFGLRREEAIKFTPSRDDRGDRIRLKGSTTKGGRPREVPVRNESQRRLLDEARGLAGGGALIPPDRNYKQQLKVYENRTREAGLYRMHGLRHHYALTRYEEITGWKAPAAGGPPRRTLTGARRRIDTAARRTIARELGHDRISVVAQYIGGG